MKFVSMIEKQKVIKKLNKIIIKLSLCSGYYVHFYIPLIIYIDYIIINIIKIIENLIFILIYWNLHLE
jgi:hypothetical protein